MRAPSPLLLWKKGSRWSPLEPLTLFTLCLRCLRCELTNNQIPQAHTWYKGQLVSSDAPFLFMLFMLFMQKARSTLKDP